MGSAGSMDKASGNFCLRCLACCAAYQAKFGLRAQPVAPSSPNAAKSASVGMALIPEDRKTEGLMLPMSLRDNLSFASLERISRGGVIDHAREMKLVGDMVGLLAIRASGTDIPVGALSGGNQQKVVIAKWLMAEPRIILLNDPTRGIDVGTKQEIYQLLRRLADAGAAIVFYTTDYSELIGCCDRAAGALRRRHQARAGGRRDHREGAHQQRAQPR